MKKRELNFAEIKAMKDGYIPAPYVLEEDDKINFAGCIYESR